MQNVVTVAFKLTDNSYRPVNTSPALLASLGGASDDVNQDALPATLAPGDTLYAAAGFDITQITGLPHPSGAARAHHGAWKRRANFLSLLSRTMMRSMPHMC